MPTYYGQNREDEWIDKNLPLPGKGFYVDIGCGHPFTTSNTAFLRDRKWDGLAIDGFRGWEEDWRNIPAFYCAVIVSPYSDKRVFFKEDHDNPYWSRISDKELPTFRLATTIETILSDKKIGRIDFLSVDTEGTELEVLESFNFERHNPPVVVAEFNAAHLPIVEPQDSPIPDFMRSKGYELKRTFGIVNMVFAK